MPEQQPTEPVALVTGAAGFVGGHIARALVDAGYKVRCGVRTARNARHLDGLPVELVPLHLDRPDELARATENAGVVVHAAGITRAVRAADYRAVNAEGTRRLAGAAAAAGARRFVLVSSLAARGPDDRLGDNKDRPASAYGRSKLEAEARLRDVLERTGRVDRMEAVALRPAAVYGPRDRDLLPLFKTAAAGWLPFPNTPAPLQPVHAADVARAALAAVREGSPGFGPFPVAESGLYGWRSVPGMMERALARPVRAVALPPNLFALAGAAGEALAGLRGKSPDFDRRRARDLAFHSWTCDVSGTEKALGWRAEVPLPEGLALTARWYRRAGWLGIKAR